jgi:hypothetical protein
MKWIALILIAAVVCGFIAYAQAEDGDKKEAAFEGAAAGAVGCGATLFYIVMSVAGLLLLIQFVGWLFS